MNIDAPRLQISTSRNDFDICKHVLTDADQENVVIFNGEAIEPRYLIKALFRPPGTKQGTVNIDTMNQYGRVSWGFSAQEHGMALPACRRQAGFIGRLRSGAILGRNCTKRPLQQAENQCETRVHSSWNSHVCCIMC